MNCKILYILFALIIFSLKGYSQSCSSDDICAKNILGEHFDYRGQSTFGRLSPGDTSRVKVVLYSKNEIRIAACGEEILGTVDFRILKTVRDYKRIVERIDKKIETKNDYELKNGKRIVTLDKWGDPLKSTNGDTIFKIRHTSQIEINDTIWKTIREVKEEELFDSRKNSNNQLFYEEYVDKTKSIIIEVIVPSASNQKKKNIEGCVAIMVGRYFQESDK